MLRLEIDGAWEPQDFIEVLQATESMYYKLAHPAYRYSSRFLFFEEMRLFERQAVYAQSYETLLDTINERLLDRARYESAGYERLRVKRINYASPGGLDLIGIGKVCEVIADSIGRMKVYFDDRHVRRERDEQARIETERKRVELEKEQESLRATKIENAKNALELLDRHPEENEWLLPLLVRDQDALSNRIAERKLITASTHLDEPPERS